MGGRRPRIRLTRQGVVINGKLREPDVTARRQVHRLGDFVVKVDHGNQNWREWRNWTRRIHPRDRRYFAPVLAYSGPDEPQGPVKSWLIQRRIQFRPGPPSQAARAKIAELAERYRFRDLLTGDEAVRQSNHARNWGVSVNGTPTIFDYAD